MPSYKLLKNDFIALGVSQKFKYGTTDEQDVSADGTPKWRVQAIPCDSSDSKPDIVNVTIESFDDLESTIMPGMVTFTDLSIHTSYNRDKGGNIIWFTASDVRQAK
jgi:hypothetical protein